MRNWKTWIKAAGIRAAKTFCQTAVAMLPASAMITEVGWGTVLGTAALAAVASLRKGLREAGAALPVAALEVLCRFVSVTQNEFKGGVIEAMDRAACLYVLPHLRDRGADVDSVKTLFAAMPRMIKALEAVKP